MKDALLDTIIDEYATVEAFASLLAVEQKALTTAYPGEVLKPIVEQKTSMADKLAMLERARESHLRERGLPAGKRGMDLAAAEDARLNEQWGLLQKSAERARKLNFNNGLMIRTRMDYNRRILAVLRGTPEKASTFYGPDGKVPMYSGL
ncbi:flagella synthesis protein FlgN [Paraburkholderia sp. SOS3]|jgi:flagella synthesis protein FlgN|uniref:flagella synthesis protein FlgN n=1 Tax=Paraburkholderia sp. SOS3 TaxID=1926494 RepID=UPI0009477BCC|nr:flagellar protein FlgN [Paraburkholderia sp. SOS3]APR37300.1 flagellar biosynthesis protein FlgN [Paraburkholderia sp. SOS3]